jgi:Holliday junction resolvasome RuvABC ATP-dependent DNA helicase subunit
MDTLCRRYVEILEEFGGSASLSLLKSALHVDEGTLRNVVEPVLLRKGVIRISQKGRCLTNVNF